MSDQISICNRALAEMGSRSTIANLREGSLEADTCATLFDSTRDEVLAKAWWNGARRTQTLALLKALPGTPENTNPPAAVWNNSYPAPPWLYEYAYPNDCITARYIIAQFVTGGYTGVPIFSTPMMYAAELVSGAAIRFVTAVSQDQDGNSIRVVLTNQPQATLVYTGRIVDTGLWDPAFEDAFVYSLAAKLVIPLSGDRALASDLYKIANTKILEARARDANEGLTIQQSNVDWLAVRGYGDSHFGNGLYGPLNSVS